VKDVFRTIIDEIGEGIIVINSDGIIDYYNKKAKKIFGIIFNQGMGHDAGKIERGDMVIIADSSLGEDDGGLLPEDLSRIGVDGSKLVKGHPFIAIGIMGGRQNSGVVEYSGENENKKQLAAKDSFFGKEVMASLDLDAKVAVISVGENSYPFKFIKSIGHIVVVSGETGEVKFYQARGYTTRRDDIRMLLTRQTFRAKGKENMEMNIVGQSIFDIHPKESNIDIVELLEVAKGKDISYIGQIKEINGSLTRCSLLQLKNEGNIVGAMLKVEDITELDNVTKERDSAIASLNEVENKLKVKDATNRIIGQSESINAIRRLTRKASETNSTVLILGESGTGKGLIAECIHDSSKRNEKPFLYVNCASIPSELIESELFGYEGGAFTGSKKEGKKGVFETADGGIVFLDEIGEIPLFMQVKLLHVLQNKKFTRVGSTQPVEVDVKIIAATNKDLERAVKEGAFREDLYYRINVIPIVISPLRQRKEDIYPLIMHLLPQICKRTGVKEKRISVDVIKEMLSYDWPGNVRELENFLERAVNITDGDTILLENTNIRMLKSRGEGNNAACSLSEAIESAEKVAIENAIKVSGGDKIQAINLLDISKSSFYGKLKKYKLGS